MVNGTTGCNGLPQEFRSAVLPSHGSKTKHILQPSVISHSLKDMQVFFSLSNVPTNHFLILTGLAVGMYKKKKKKNGALS